MLVKPTVLLFTNFDSNSLIKSDTLKGSVKSFSHPDFKFAGHVTIQIGPHLYALLSSGHEKMSVVKYADACLVKEESSAPLKTLLNTSNDARERFAVAYHEQTQSIFVVGGRINGQASATVLRFKVSDDRFQHMPKMQTGRYHFTAVAAGNFIYAIGGTDDFSNLATIEMLEVGPHAPSWTTIRSNAFTARGEACAVALSPEKILIMGGKQSGQGSDWLSDVLMLENSQGKVAL